MDWELVAVAGLGLALLVAAAIAAGHMAALLFVEVSRSTGRERR